MNDDLMLNAEDVANAINYPTLGPAYYTARRMAEALMAGAEAEPLKTVAEKVTTQIRDAVYDYVETFMLGDLESNLQSHIRNTVERTVEALLTGQEWAMRQYPFADYSRGEKIRKAVAQHGGYPLQERRIKDLEKEVARLQESLKYARGRYE